MRKAVEAERPVRGAGAAGGAWCGAPWVPFSAASGLGHAVIMMRRGWDPERVSTEFRQFWAERHNAVLVTPRRDGTPHVVVVGVTLDVEAGVARVICRRGSQKARNVAAAGPGGVRVAISQVDGRRWSTLEGVGVLRADRPAVADAERRYAERYHAPRENPERVVIEIRVDRLLGMR